MSQRIAIALVAAGLTGLWATGAPAQDSYSPDAEAQNVLKQKERYQYDVGTPAFMQAQGELGTREQAARAQIAVKDPERNPDLQACGPIRQYGCLGDPYLWDWEAKGHGIVRPVLFTARNGATLSGNVWATRAGPAKRPAIVFITGSIQVPEPDYWFAAVTWAKRGFVVLTFDVQGQGVSDTYGEGADRNEGVPSQAGEPFYDGGEDALDFLLSTPSEPYLPRKSCTTGTSHAAKQERRVKAGFDAAYDPLWAMVDREHIGIAGQSLGAAAASFIGQADPRVDAIVGMDNLDKPSASSQQGTLTCASAPATRTEPAISKPGLGISNDYFLTPNPYATAPDPAEKAATSLAFSKAGVDSMQVNVRGGTHAECAFVSMAYPGATLRGVDLCAWYAAAWFDKFLKGDATADRRLLTGRWRSDSRDAEIDPAGKGNLFSFDFRSRLDLHLTSSGERVVCENLRTGCSSLVADDGEPAGFGYRKLALTADAGAGTGTPDTGGAGGGPSAGGASALPNRRTVALTAPRLASDAGRSPQFDVRIRPRGGTGRPTARYELDARVLPSGAWRRMASRIALGGRARFRGRYGRAYAFRARAVDGAGFAGSWAHASTVVPFDGVFRGIASRSTSIYRGAWRRVSDRAAWGRTLSVSVTPHATFATRLSGRRLYVVGRVSPRGGLARLVVDGRTRTISFRSRRTRERVVLASLRLRPGAHLIGIAHAGPAGREIALDGLAVAP